MIFPYCKICVEKIAKFLSKDDRVNALAGGGGGAVSFGSFAVLPTLKSIALVMGYIGTIAGGFVALISLYVAFEKHILPRFRKTNEDEKANNSTG